MGGSMRLKNKKTGEILGSLGSFIIQNPNRINCESIIKYDSLAELNEDWEDYEGPKEHIMEIDRDGMTVSIRYAHYEEAEKALTDQRNKVAELTAEYEKASDTVDQMYAKTYQYEQAGMAIQEENYEKAITLLADESGARLEYYKKKKALSDADREELQKNLDANIAAVEEYKIKMEQGLEGYTEAGLDELKRYVFEAKSILNGIYVGQEWLAGLKKGLEDPTKQQELKEASVKVGNLIVNTTKKTMQIRSPSRIAEQIGVMWDKGLVKGMEEKEDEIELAAESLANTIQNASTPEMFGTGYNALTASGVGYGATSNAYTTNMGGITIKIEGAGAVDEDVLAQRVAVQLTHELQRAQRGGRR